MKNIIYWLQILVSSILIFLILIQPKRGEFSFGGSYFKRRGIEKIVFFLTIIFAIFFVVLALLNLVLK